MGDTAVEPTLHWTDGSAVRESSSASHTTGTDVQQQGRTERCSKWKWSATTEREGV